MIRAQPFFVVVFAIIGWLMLRIGVGMGVLGGYFLFGGNGWAVLLFLPSAAGLVLGAYAVRLAVRHLAGGPAGWR